MLTPSTKQVIDICVCRKYNGLSCKECVYYGKVCEKVKHKYNVTSPYLIDEDKDKYINATITQSKTKRKGD